MPDYDNTNSGTLFKNDRKTTNNQPDHKGSMEVKCQHCSKNSFFWLSAWIKTAGQAAKNPGSRFFSLALTDKEDQTQPESKPKETSHGEFADDDIPF